MDDSRDIPKGPWATRRGLPRGYMHAINRFHLLTQSGEARLATLVRGGSTTARDRLVEGNLRLVVRIAREYTHAGVPFDDLVAEGNIGLIEATVRFDPARNVRFANYAGWWIRKRMMAAIHRSAFDATAPVPREPSAPRPGRLTDDRNDRPRRRRILSFEELLPGQNAPGSGEPADASPPADADAVVLAHEVADAIGAVLHRIPEVERRILEMHFGLGRDEPVSLREIGLTLGCTKERVRQIEMRALARARRLIERAPPLSR